MNDRNKPWLPSPTWKETWREDYRIQGQEGYLLNKHLQHRKFDRKLCVEDFDQCEFCWSCFDEDKSCPLNAYFEPMVKVWICEDCFNDFKEHFHWTVDEIDEKGEIYSGESAPEKTNDT